MSHYLRPAALTLLWVAAGHGQTTFEVVSVKSTGSNRFACVGPCAPVTIPQQSFRYSGQRLSCQLPLREIVQEAYSLKDLQIEGPDWLASETYRIDAVMPAGTTKEGARPMLQKMLEERFGMRSHREQKDVPVYALVEGKGGFKLHAIAYPNHPTQRDMATPMGTVRASRIQTRGQFTAVSITIADLAASLANMLDRPVVNLTEIPGDFAIDLRWTPDAPGAVDTELMRTVERQLGLKLDARKLPFEILRIDHIEKVPTGN